MVDALKRDPQLVQPDGKHEGALAFRWSYGLVLTNITRKQFEAAELQHGIEPHRVLCQDEMLESVGAEDLQCRLWDMFPYMMRDVISLPQQDRVRWIMFPQVRVQTWAHLAPGQDKPSHRANLWQGCGPAAQGVYHLPFPLCPLSGPNGENYVQSCDGRCE